MPNDTILVKNTDRIAVITRDDRKLIFQTSGQIFLS